MGLFANRDRRPERLLWTRDMRFVNRLREAVPSGRTLELDAGALFVAAEGALTDEIAAAVAADVHGPEYGMVLVDSRLPLGDRYVVAMSAAVQMSGIAERVGMGQTVQNVQTKALDYFFACRNLHGVEFQPIVQLSSGRIHEYECLFRPLMPNLPRSISAIVQAAIDTERSVELDSFIFRAIVSQAATLQTQREERGAGPLAIAINLTPTSLLDERFDVPRMLQAVESVGLDPTRITLECTEQQAVPNVTELATRVHALREAGFGFAVDDAGAGYASFSMVAAIRPTVIKIDRAIVAGVAGDDARQALVDAFLSFGRRIGAAITAEGIEETADLETLIGLGVQYGQGYLLGRPKPELRDDAIGDALDVDPELAAAGDLLTELLSRQDNPFGLERA
ncbi:MAG: EAL domain-containing protein [Chloroflexi bacterium]|nr:EAL domain-containing protein [Chloroflexota bacterium]